MSVIVSLQTKFRGHAGHYAELTGPFTDKRGHWPKKFVSDKLFEPRFGCRNRGDKS